MVPLQKLTSIATDRLAKEMGFGVRDRGGQRYGAWEWSWVRRQGSSAYYVTLGALEAGDHTYRIEVGASADDGPSHGKQQAGTLGPTPSDKLESDPEPVVQMLLNAAKQTLTVSPKDSYPEPLKR